LSFRGTRLTIGLITALVALVVIGSGAAMAISHRKTAAVTSGASVPSNSARPSTSSASATSSSSDLVHPTVPPNGPSTNLTVQMSPAVARSSRSTEVQQLLQGYFDAINQHNYASWAQQVGTKIAASQSSSEWSAAYATTVDSNIWMESMTNEPLQVGLRFTSQQDPDLAPKDLPVACIDWLIRYYIGSEDGHLVVGSTVPGSVTMTKC